MRYAGTVDIVGGTHDVGGLPNGGGWNCKGEDCSARYRVVCKSASGRKLEILESSTSGCARSPSKARSWVVARVVVDLIDLLTFVALPPAIAFE
jgi:hypothetical protein